MLGVIFAPFLVKIPCILNSCYVNGLFLEKEWKHTSSVINLFNNFVPFNIVVSFCPMKRSRQETVVMFCCYSVHEL